MINGGSRLRQFRFADRACWPIMEGKNSNNPVAGRVKKKKALHRDVER